MTVETTWTRIRAKLRSGQVIPNWTQLKGEIGDTFIVTEVTENAICVDAPGAATVQRVPRADFEGVLKIWAGYKAGTVPRNRTAQVTRYSKYVISIVRWCEMQA